MAKGAGVESGFVPIARQRIVDRIRSAATHRVVLIIAPAGYGKSVAVGQYLETLRTTQCVRYDVRPDNRTLLGFIRGFAESLGDRAASALKTLPAAYDKTSGSNTPGVDLAAWMYAHIKAFAGIIAIDDLHVTADDPEVCSFLVALVARTKGSVRWIIASRSSLTLPIASWLAYSEMDLPVDEVDLPFTLAEARTEATVLGVRMPDVELRGLLDLTRGWPTALSFALRTSMRLADLRSVAASTREMVYRYLAEQVYLSLDDAQRELLHLVGVLPEVDVEVLRAVGYSNPTGALEELRNRVAFIYTERPGVYRCHDLFRDFLRHQLDLLGDDRRRAVYVSAAKAVEPCGKIALALSLYADARSQDDVLRVLAGFGFQLIEQAHIDVVTQAVDSLPAAIRSADPTVLGLRGVNAKYLGQYDRCESLLGAALKVADDRTLRAQLSLRLADVLYAQSRDVVEVLEPVADDSAVPFEMRVLAVSLLAPAYALAGRTNDARTMIGQAEEYLTMLHQDDIRARLLHRLGVAELLLGGNREVAERYFTRAVDVARSCALYVTAAAALGGLASLFMFYEDDLRKQALYGRQSFDAAVKAGDRFSMQTALLHVLSVEVIRGDTASLQEVEEQLARVTTTDSARAAFTYVARGFRAAWSGQFREAARLLALDCAYYSFDTVFNRALDAFFLAASGDSKAASDAVVAVLAECDKCEVPHLHAQRRVEMARILCAAADAFAGRISRAMKILASVRSMHGGAVDTLREVVSCTIRALKNPLLRPELDAALAALSLSGYGGVARAFERATHLLFEQSADNNVALTVTERAILSGIADGGSAKELALERGCSVATVNAHLKSIIRKLGCSGRVEALSIARKRGLLR